MKTIKQPRAVFINILGILLAFGVILGGAFAVQLLLAGEEASLLQSSGRIQIASSAEEGESAVPGDAELSAGLTEEELLQAVQSLEEETERYLHEPEPGQLTMAQALDQGRKWLEDFLLPGLGISPFLLGEYRANCYLWSPLEENPSFGYWSVTIITAGMETELILDGTCGQVLDADVSCSFPAEYREQEDLITILWDYCGSFGLPDDFLLISSADDFTDGRMQTLYQSLGSQGLYAVLDVDDIAIVNPEDDKNEGGQEYTEFFRIHLYLKAGL